MPSRKTPRHHRSHRTTLSLQKTEVIINVYDLLPPGRLSSTLWFFGASLHHSGVVIGDREYAYGGHDRPGLTGVYWTKPKTEPPGAVFRCEILQGFTLAQPSEIEAIIRAVSDEFPGTAYNLLTKNCNHFTDSLCRKLTGRPGPAWLNRAASIGVALPCIVPRNWVEPPDYESGQALLDVDADGDESWDDRYADESSRMMRDWPSSETPRLVGEAEQHRGSRENAERSTWDREDDRVEGAGRGATRVPVRDTAGRNLPPAERAPPARASASTTS
ncbi:hypothetical protein VTK73DRAFT_9301 [Phialemonium thermophilum]|uniref:PPPDE domain-containing protein n=1 Tax=Phialemonium thermophilum TaxID=223376 RepID=A0ABR3XL30_9PEZI